MEQSDEKTAKILKRKTLNLKILKFGCLPIGGLYVVLTILFAVIGSSSDEEGKVEEEDLVYVSPLDELISLSVNDSIVKSYGDFFEVGCDYWPSRYKVYTFKDNPVSFVLDLNSKLIAAADSLDSKACYYVIEKRQNLINSQFSNNGYHIKLMYLVQGAMNDPESFEHVETRYKEYTKDGQDILFVHMKYRGKNAFGAKVINAIGVTAELDGTILDIFQGEDLPRAIRKYSSQ